MHEWNMTQLQIEASCQTWKTQRKLKCLPQLKEANLKGRCAVRVQSYALMEKTVMETVRKIASLKSLRRGEWQC